MIEVFTMQIKDVIETLRTQIGLGRTPKGRVITDFGKENIKAALDDVPNYGAEATKCKNCGLVISSLLVSDGCPNCGGLDFNANIE